MKIQSTKSPVSREDAMKPGDAGWRAATAFRLLLQPTPLENQPSNYIRVLKPTHGKVGNVEVRSLYNDRSVFFRLTWTDPSQDAFPSDSKPFADGAAVMFPMPGALEMLFEGDPIAMGSDDVQVNAWMWRPEFGGKARNILARGFGTSVRTEQTYISTQAEWHDGRWHVVFGRDFAVPDKPEETATLPHPGTIPVAFAVWEGSNSERAGLKATVPHWLLLEVKS